MTASSWSNGFIPLSGLRYTLEVHSPCALSGPRTRKKRSSCGIVGSPRPALSQMLDAPRKPSAGRAVCSMQTPAFAIVSAGHRTRRSRAVAPPTRSALAASGTLPSALSFTTPPPRPLRLRSSALSVRSRTSLLRTLLFRKSVLRRLLFTTSSLSTRIKAYEVPPKATNSAAVAITFEYDKCLRIALSTARYLGRGSRNPCRRSDAPEADAAVRARVRPPPRRVSYR